MRVSPDEELERYVRTGRHQNDFDGAPARRAAGLLRAREGVLPYRRRRTCRVLPSASRDKRPRPLHDRRRRLRARRVEEILANKLTTILSRAEERDVVDLYFLERSGHRVESALDVALKKDGGCTPATLAWLLSQIEIPDAVPLPADCSPAELRTFVADLVRRLRRAAAP